MAKPPKEFTPGRGYSKEDWDAVADAPELTDEQAAQPMTIEEAREVAIRRMNKADPDDRAAVGRLKDRPA